MLMNKLLRPSVGADLSALGGGSDIQLHLFIRIICLVPFPLSHYTVNPPYPVFLKPAAIPFIVKRTA
jgi:hypothetical protein